MNNGLLQALEYICEQIGLSVDWTMSSATELWNYVLPRYQVYMISRYAVVLCVVSAFAVLYFKQKPALRKWLYDDDYMFALNILIEALIIIVYIPILMGIVSAVTFPELGMAEKIIGVLHTR